MNQKLQLPNDALTQHQRQAAAQQAYVQQFVRETAKELFVKHSRSPSVIDGNGLLVQRDDSDARLEAKHAIRDAKIFTEEALGVRFEEEPPQ